MQEVHVNSFQPREEKAEDIQSGKITDNDIEVMGTEIPTAAGQVDEIVISYWEAVKKGTRELRPFARISTLKEELKLEKETEKLININPRSAKQLLDTLIKLKAIDVDKADAYLQQHRAKFEKELDRIIREL